MDDDRLKWWTETWKLHGSGKHGLEVRACQGGGPYALSWDLEGLLARKYINRPDLSDWSTALN